MKKLILLVPVALVLLAALGNGAAHAYTQCETRCGNAESKCYDTYCICRQFDPVFHVCISWNCSGTVDCSGNATKCMDDCHHGTAPASTVSGALLVPAPKPATATESNCATRCHRAASTCYTGKGCTLHDAGALGSIWFCPDSSGFTCGDTETACLNDCPL